MGLCGRRAGTRTSRWEKYRAHPDKPSGGHPKPHFNLLTRATRPKGKSTAQDLRLRGRFVWRVGGLVDALPADFQAELKLARVESCGGHTRLRVKGIDRFDVEFVDDVEEVGAGGETQALGETKFATEAQIIEEGPRRVAIRSS
jgi:hypothetical protein